MHKAGGQSLFLSLLCSWIARTKISPVALGLTGVMKVTRNLTKFRKPLPIYLIWHRIVAGVLSGRADCKLCKGHPWCSLHELSPPWGELWGSVATGILHASVTPVRTPRRSLLLYVGLEQLFCSDLLLPSLEEIRNRFIGKKNITGATYQLGTLIPWDSVL